jgi:hypothetical protein
MSNQENSNQQEKQAKSLRGVLVNLDLAVAEVFYDLARSGKFFNKKSPTAVARELIQEFVAKNSKVEEVTEVPSDS